MALYFFDIDDGRAVTRDVDGVDCASRIEIRNVAISVLPELASDRLPNGDQTVLSVNVRDGEGRYVFRATLSLIADWLNVTP